MKYQISIVLMSAAILVNMSFFVSGSLSNDIPSWEVGNPVLSTGSITSLFMKNRGQISDGSVDFYLLGDPMSFIFKRGEFLLDARNVKGDAVEGDFIEISFIDSNEADPVGCCKTEGDINFLLGSDPTGWFTNIPSYKGLKFNDIWDGVELGFEVIGGELNYEITVDPGGDVDDILMGLVGMGSISIDEKSGDLLISSSNGMIIDRAPISYQYAGNGRIKVESSYRIIEDGTLGFDIGEYDTSLPLTIDLSIGFSSYLGGTSVDEVQDVSVDEDGSIYTTGKTSSTDFPTTPGAYSTSLTGTSTDIFVTKMLGNSSLVYSTYIGGSGGDFPGGIEVDDNGSVYVGGTSTSTDFPTTNGVISTTTTTGQDGVIFKLETNGSALNYSTYLGASHVTLYDLDIDDDGYAFITGEAGSGLPTTNDAFDESFNSGTTDGFISRINEDATKLNYSTYLGGSSTEYLYDIEVDNEGCVYVTGWTYSTDYPVTDEAFQRSLNGSSDGILTKMVPNGSKLNFSTYIGGLGFDGCYGIDVDEEGIAFIQGSTRSSDFPTSSWAYKKSIESTSVYETFVMKMNASGNGTSYSTIIGKIGNGNPWGIVVDDDGYAWVTGETNFNGYPITTDAYDSTRSNREAYITRINMNGSSIEYSSFLGGSGDDCGYRLDLLNDTGLISVGYTSSSDFPVTTGAFMTSYGGGRDGFVFLLPLSENEPPEFGQDLTPNSATTGDPLEFNITVTDDSGVEKVEVLYSYGQGGGSMNRSMERTSGDEMNGTYSLGILIPSDFTGTMTYSFSATDNGNLSNSTDPIEVSVTDNDSPYLLEDHSDTKATTGDRFHFRARVDDNIGISGVWVEYWLGMDGMSNVSMNLLMGAPNWTYAFDISGDRITEFGYMFRMNDTSDNWNETDWVDVTISDNDKPYILQDLSPAYGTTGDLFNLSVSADDNVDLFGIWVEYWFGTSSHINTSLMMTSDRDGTFDIMVPIDSIENLHYILHFNDTSGNWNHTMERTIPISDNDLPIFISESSDQHPIKGLSHEFSIEVTDNIRISSVNVELSFDGGQVQNKTMVLEGYSHRVGILVPRESTMMEYSFHFSDSSGNWNGTSKRMIQTRNSPPMVDDIIWEVIEEQITTLDLSDNITDLNDPLTNLVLTGQGTFTIDALNITIYFEDWEPEHMITLNISDGEETVLFTITIRIINVNDIPMFLTEPIEVINAGETYSLYVQVYDKDLVFDDELGAVETPTGMTFNETGWLIWETTTSDIGQHPVSIYYFDGYVTIYLNWTITVIYEGDNRPPFFTNDPPSSVTAGSYYNWTAEAEDPDEDLLTFSLVEGPMGAEMDPSGSLSWLSLRNKKGTFELVDFKVRVSDNLFYIDLDFTVNVTFPANLPPKVKDDGQPMKIKLDENMEVDLTPYMSDPDDPLTDLTWSIVDGEGDSVTVTVFGNTLRVVPKGGVKGTITVTLRLTDPYGASDDLSIEMEMPSEEEDDKDDDPVEMCLGLWWLALIILIIIVLIIIWLSISRRKNEEEEE